VVRAASIRPSSDAFTACHTQRQKIETRYGLAKISPGGPWAILAGGHLPLARRETTGAPRASRRDLRAVPAVGLWCVWAGPKKFLRFLATHRAHAAGGHRPKCLLLSDIVAKVGSPLQVSNFRIQRAPRLNQSCATHLILESMLHARIRKFFLQQYRPIATKLLRCRDCSLSAMCGRLRVGKSFFHVCSLGRCSHVFGL